MYTPAAEEYLQLPAINNTNSEAENTEASNADEYIEGSVESEL